MSVHKDIGFDNNRFSDNAFYREPSIVDLRSYSFNNNTSASFDGNLRF